MGPCALIDLIGIDIHVHASEALYEALREPRMAPPPRLVAHGAGGPARPQVGRGLLQLRRGLASRQLVPDVLDERSTRGSLIEATKLMRPAAKTCAPAASRSTSSRRNVRLPSGPGSRATPASRAARRPCARVDLDPVLGRRRAVAERRCPRRARARRRVADDDTAPAAAPVVGADVLDADERRLRPPERRASLRRHAAAARRARRARRSCSPRGTSGCRRGRGSAAITS